MMTLSTRNRLGLLLGSLMLLAVLLYHETAAAMWALWTSKNNPTYSHGPLLMLVSIYLLYSDWRKNGDHLKLNLSYVGVIGVVGSSLLWFLASLGSVQIIQMLSFVALLTFLFIGVLGFQQAKPYLFPIVLMVGALPVWEVFGPYLQANSAIMAGWLTSHTIHPSIREGMLIHIPAGSFEVETGCSGIAYFIVSIIISLLFVHGHPMSIWRRLMFVLSAMLIAIVSNVIRVYIIVLSGELTNMQSYFIKEEHVSLGWVIFFIGISIYLWQAGRFLPKPIVQNSSMLDEGDTTKLGIESADGLVVAEFQQRAGENDTEKQPVLTAAPRWMLVTLLLITAMFLGPLINGAFLHDSNKAIAYEIQFPDRLGSWNRTKYQDSYHPTLQRGDAIEEANYVGAEASQNIFVLVNYFYRQHQGAEAVSDMNHLSDKQNWVVVGSTILHPDVPGFGKLKETSLVARNGAKKLTWFWYETNNIRTSSNWVAKLQNILGILRGSPSIRVVVLATDVISNEVDARNKLKDFIEKMADKIQVTSAPS